MSSTVPSPSPSPADQPQVGAYSVIHPDATLHPTALVGSHVIVDEGATVADAAVIGSGTYVGAGVKVAASARIGANATLLPGITIAAKAEIRAGSVVTRSVPPAAIVEGNPATITGYVDAPVGPHSSIHTQTAASRNAVETTDVKGVTVYNFPVIADMRGNLTAGEFEKQIPFTPKRYFMVFGVPNEEVRGEHAHRECHQFLVCARGSCAVVVDDGARRLEIALNAPNRGVHLPPMTWGIQYKYSPDSLLLVFASHHYEAADYIRDYGQFLRLVGKTSTTFTGT